MQLLDNGYQLNVIFGYAVEFIWDLVANHLQKGIEYADGKYSLAGIKKMIADKKAFLFYVVKEHYVMSVLVLKINEYECSKRACLFLLAGNDMKEWIGFLEIIKKWVKESGCDAIELFGRPGWEKKLKNKGFEKTHIILRMQLKD